MRRLLPVLVVSSLVPALLGAGAATGTAAATPTASAEACFGQLDADLSWGVPAGWETATDGGGGASWHRDGDTVATGWRTRSTVDGTGPKDDRLIAPPLVVGPDAQLWFAHTYVLGAQARGLVEVSVDGGRTFSVLPAPTSGHGAGSGDAEFSGAGPWALLTNREHWSEIDLSAFAGQEIRLAWRLVADGPGAPGWWDLAAAQWTDVADPSCVDGSRPELACSTTAETEFVDGLPVGWEVDTATNVDGTRPWQVTREGFREVSTEASGLNEKDDRLVSPTFRATGGSGLAFWHLYALEPGVDGGRLEYTTDGGATWHGMDPAWFRVGGYDGSLADGRPGWTGVHASQDQPLMWSGPVAVHVDLSQLDGEDVRVRWRLLQTAGAAPVAGRGWTVRDGIRFFEVVGDTTCGDLDDDVRDVCDSLAPPSAVDVAGVIGDGSPLRLDVRVALDVAEGAEIALLRRSDPGTAAQRMAELERRVRQVLDPAAVAYESLGIEVAMTFDLLAPLDPDGNPRQRVPGDRTDLYTDVVGEPRMYSDELFELAKRQYGNRPPEAADVVYVATDLELGASVAGVADCVGGAAYDQHSFAVGQLGGLGPDIGATVMAHEVAHLLGAHHHLANCVESLPHWLTGPQPGGQCTLMSPDVFLAAPVLSTVNGSIVRGYVSAYGAETGG